jgi:RES domain-containing protein
MTCYRVVRRKYADLSGEGARLFGGRFNPPGIPAVYSSQNIALAVLEMSIGRKCRRTTSSWRFTSQAGPCFDCEASIFSAEIS